MINGHIVNESILRASRRTVIQYGRVDHFYGKVEANFVQFLNMPVAAPEGLFKAASKITIITENGERLRAFFGSKGAAAKFPTADLSREGLPVDGLFVHTDRDDPRLRGRLRVECGIRQMPSHWTASLLKSGYLALFAIFGYTVVTDPCLAIIRDVLARYFTEDGRPEDAPSYFGEFDHAARFMVTPDVLSPVDTLASSEFLIHWTPENVRFALSCLFRLNEVTWVVTLPTSAEEGQRESALLSYGALMADTTVPQVVRVGRCTGSTFEIGPRPMPVRYTDMMPPKGC